MAALAVCAITAALLIEMVICGWRATWAYCVARIVPRDPGGMGRLRPAAHAGMLQSGNYAVTACFWSLLVTWMLRGLAASWTGMVRVSTPAA